MKKVKKPSLIVSQSLIEILSPHAEFSFLMGSAETERFNKESDIDVAVFWKTSCDPEQIKACQRIIEEKFNRDVDLISLNKINVIFARQVLETGRLLFCNSDGLLLNWKMQKLSDYPDFKFSRKIIEDNILNRKKYG